MRLKVKPLGDGTGRYAGWVVGQGVVVEVAGAVVLVEEGADDEQGEAFKQLNSPSSLTQSILRKQSESEVPSATQSTTRTHALVSPGQRSKAMPGPCLMGSSEKPEKAGSI